jgi:hypothetical protein
VFVQGNATLAEVGDDVFVATGAVRVQGALAASETGSDTFAAAGDVFVQGSLDATEAGSDTFFASGSQSIFGALDATEQGQDTLAATGSVAQGVTGTLAATESGQDTAAFDGRAAVVASTKGGRRASLRGVVDASVFVVGHRHRTSVAIVNAGGETEIKVISVAGAAVSTGGRCKSHARRIRAGGGGRCFARPSYQSTTTGRARGAGTAAVAMLTAARFAEALTGDVEADAFGAVHHTHTHTVDSLGVGYAACVGRFHTTDSYYSRAVGEQRVPQVHVVTLSAMTAHRRARRRIY